MITSITKLDNYIALMQQTADIESKFASHLDDSLNAEIVSGLITNMTEAFDWFKNTFFWVRIIKNPLAYGINTEQLQKRINEMDNFNALNQDLL